MLYMDFRLPVFDVKIRVQKRNAYTRASQNELALQLYGLGFFMPQSATPALSCLEMMDFEGKDELMQRIAQNGTIFQQLQQMIRIALALTQRYEPQNTEQLLAMVQGQAPATPAAGGQEKPRSMPGEESPVTKKARERSGKTTDVQ